MSERAPYSRVYWLIRNDPRLVAIYPDNNHLATWLRLLIAADMAWPAPADLPLGVNKRSLQVLVDAGVVEVVGSLFSFHGLDSERGRRRTAAQESIAHRWGNARNTDVSDPNTERSTSRAEPSRAELKPSRAEAGAGATDPADTYWQLTGKYPTDKTLAWIDDLAGQYGRAPASAAIAAAYTEDTHISTLLGRVKARLARHARQLDLEEREAELARITELRKPVVLKVRPPDATPEEAAAALAEYEAVYGKPRPLRPGATA